MKQLMRMDARVRQAEKNPRESLRGSRFERMKKANKTEPWQKKEIWLWRRARDKLYKG